MKQENLVSKKYYRSKEIIREVEHATFLSYGRTLEVYCFPILLVFTLPHLHF